MFSAKEKVKCRKVKAVQYAHHLLSMFFPFQNESVLCSIGTYMEKLSDPQVMAIVNENKQRF